MVFYFTFDRLPLKRALHERERCKFDLGVSQSGMLYAYPTGLMLKYSMSLYTTAQNSSS